ncbi:MAG: polysaccharide deacetylase family protein [Bacteroidetes bacterium]|nr:polysaccharide deacetylase family protein [Bacteroidota bacterium]
MDDLPLSIAARVDNAELDRVTTLLLEQIKDARTPVTAFVNENKLEVKGQRDSQRVATMKRWLDAGIALGNHTYAHKSQNRVPVPEAKEDIVKGMRTIHQLYAERGGRPEWFRHPYLQTGRDSLTRATLTAFLDSLGYRIAPVTLDNADWLFASAYDKAFAANDSAGMRAVAAEYLPYMTAKARYYEWMSDTLFGRQIPQILLLHANRLNGDHYAALCAEFRKMGYAFITLDEAMNDPVYRQYESFFGAAGISWLERWALTRGAGRTFFAKEVPVPMSIKERAGIYEE